MLEVGTSVRHRRLRHLTGTIVGHNTFRECGQTKITVVPYKIEWDDPLQAVLDLGIFHENASEDEVCESRRDHVDV